MEGDKLNNITHIALTGHRPNKLYGYNLNHPKYKELQLILETIIEKALTRNQIVVGHSGLALGADTIWSKAIFAMKTKYPDRVKFHAEIPMMTQSDVWFKQSDKDYWQYQIDNADMSSVYDSEFSQYKETHTEQESKYRAIKALDKRNKGMMEHADVVIAVYDGTKGGTRNAVNDVKRLGNRPLIVIHPETFDITNGGI